MIMGMGEGLRHVGWDQGTGGTRCAGKKPEKTPVMKKNKGYVYPERKPGVSR